MKDTRTTRKSYRARFNQARRHLDEIAVLLDLDPDKMAPTDIADLRNQAEQLLQCVHEFSAYWNVVHT